MTSIHKLTLTALAAAGLAAATIHTIHAQPKPLVPAYVINEVQVTDQAGFATYAKRQGVLIEKFGGHFLARGGATEMIAGQPTKSRITIYAFDSMAKANAWHDAPEQAELVAIRDKSSVFRSYVVEGCAGCKPPAM
ncbi:MAG TPA: DUF1330 domain-containing protein [Xanthobacteraceae bacterium]